MSENESYINVPIDKKTRDNLKKRAESNGRATTREAAEIIKRSVNR